MKKLLVLLLALGSFSAFATVYGQCEGTMSYSGNNSEEIGWVETSMNTYKNEASDRIIKIVVYTDSSKKQEIGQAEFSVTNERTDSAGRGLIFTTRPIEDTVTLFLSETIKSAKFQFDDSQYYGELWGSVALWSDTVSFAGATTLDLKCTYNPK